METASQTNNELDVPELPDSGTDTLAASLLTKIAQEPCACVRCGDCGGTGSIWLDFAGRYLGNHRSDDLDDAEPCDNCGGSGIVEVCDRCQMQDELEDEEFI